MFKLLKNQNIVIYFILLLITPILSFIVLIVFRDKGYIDLQNIITLFTAIIALCVGITSVYHSERLNNKNLKQSEKNLVSQLVYEDRKKALFELYSLITPENSLDIVTKSKKPLKPYEELFIERLENFLNSPKSLFLPKNTRELLNKTLGKLYVFESKKPKSLEMPVDSELIDEHEYEELEHYENLDPEEKFGVDFSNLILESERVIQQNIENNLVDIQEEEKKN